MQRFDDPAQTIQIAVDQVFCIGVRGNPTSGYLWEARVDGHHLELHEQAYEPGQAVGAGGQETFHFRTLEVGETEILLEYRRPWEQKARDSRRFRVNIT